MHVKQMVAKLEDRIAVAEEAEQEVIGLTLEEAKELAFELPRIVEKSTRRKESLRSLQAAYHELLRLSKLARVAKF
jgi:hypothetical protein